MSLGFNPKAAIAPIGAYFCSAEFAARSWQKVISIRENYV